MEPGGVAVAEEHHGAGPLLEHVGEIFATHQRRSIGIDAGFADDLGGDCNWDHIQKSLLTTCLFAHADIVYVFSIPKNAKVTSFSHSVGAGVARCFNKKWTTTRTGGTYRATFHHGNPNNFSQCLVNHLSISYRVSKRVRI